MLVTAQERNVGIERKGYISADETAYDSEVCAL